jgi:hypothetical protein
MPSKASTSPNDSFYTTADALPYHNSSTTENKLDEKKRLEPLKLATSKRDTSDNSYETISSTIEDVSSANVSSVPSSKISTGFSSPRRDLSSKSVSTGGSDSSLRQNLTDNFNKPDASKTNSRAVKPFDQPPALSRKATYGFGSWKNNIHWSAERVKAIQRSVPAQTAERTIPIPSIKERPIAVKTASKPKPTFTPTPTPTLSDNQPDVGRKKTLFKFGRWKDDNKMSRHGQRTTSRVIARGKNATNPVESRQPLPENATRVIELSKKAIFESDTFTDVVEANEVSNEKSSSTR